MLFLQPAKELHACMRRWTGLQLADADLESGADGTLIKVGPGGDTPDGVSREALRCRTGMLQGPLYIQKGSLCLSIFVSNLCRWITRAFFNPANTRGRHRHGVMAVQPTPKKRDGCHHPG